MQTERDRIADRFRKFAQEAASHDCPLYFHLARYISVDPDLISIAMEVRRPPEPNTFLAAAHFLLMREPDHPLGRYYGSLTEHPEHPAGAFTEFRDFVADHRQELIPLLHSRITQTNEVRRCSYLVPSFQRVFEAGGSRALSLIDVGCSAGLHLLWDRYYYDYGGVHLGNSDASVQFSCELRGEISPPVPLEFPTCAFRLGVDLHPIDLNDAEERRWLEALVFPDHEDRRILLKAAIGEALGHLPRIITGDAIEILPELLDQVPEETTLCVYHCHAMCQLNEQDWVAFRDMLLAQSMHREIFWLNAEGYEVQLRHLRKGKVDQVILAHKDGHGRWMEWLAG